MASELKRAIRVQPLTGAAASINYLPEAVRGFGDQRLHFLPNSTRCCWCDN